LSNVFAQQIPVLVLSIAQSSQTALQHHCVFAPLEQSVWSLLGCLSPPPKHGFWVVQHFLGASQLLESGFAQCL
jgi:hypothetical protein